jgi:hypothetical protein
MAIRHLYGDTKPVLCSIATAQEAAKGDMVFLKAGAGQGGSIPGLIRGEDAVWSTNIATTQEEIVNGTNDSDATHFVGICAQYKNDDAVKGVRPYGNSVDNQIRVNTAGVYVGDCASATFEVGGYVGPAKQTGDLVESQKVVSVANQTMAIGRVVERGTSVTTVKFELISQSTVGGTAA